MKIRPKVVHAVDFDSSFAALLACKLNKIDLIYDIADYIETFDSRIPWFVRKTVKVLSGMIVKGSTSVILPDKNRLDNIHSSQIHKTEIVNNAPAINLNELPLNEIIVDSSKLNVIYYGAFNEDRGIREIIEAASALQSEGIIFWLAGWGALESVIEQCELNNVNFVGKLTQLQALSLLKEMSLSLIIYDPSFEHNKVASPNKIFEAMAIGTPVMVCKGTSIDVLVDKETLGVLCNYTSESIVTNLRQLTPNKLEQYSTNILSVYPLHRWEHSKDVLLRIYDKYK
jgi:glycosyltransferase involved in cell wall biosynthesis